MSDKSPLRTVLEALISILVATSLGLNAWVLNKINDHDKILAAISAKLPESFPPSRYQDSVERRFDKVEVRLVELAQKLQENQYLLIGIQESVKAHINGKKEP